jgi:hypothetical protein
MKGPSDFPQSTIDEVISEMVMESIIGINISFPCGMKIENGLGKNPF